MLHTCPHCHRQFTSSKTVSKYCGHSCASIAWRSRQNLTYAERFWSRVRKGKGCWLWQGGVNVWGYGKVRFFKRNEAAHRVAYMLTHGANSIPANRHVMHSCDVRRCSRPEHLSVGTAQENIADRVRKGHNARGDANGTRKHPERLRRGEAHGMAKLTGALVLEIRAMRQRGMTLKAIGEAVGISLYTVYDIVSGHTWRHV